MENRFDIYNEDALDYIPKLASLGVKVDAVIFDPPYGVTKDPRDKKIDLEKMWNAIFKIRKDHTPIIVFCQMPYTIELGASNMKELRYDLIYEKTQATGFFNAKKMPLRAHENILVFYKSPPVYNPQMSEGHKPVNSFTRRVEVQNRSTVYGKTTKEIKGGGSTQRYPRSVMKFSSDKQKSSLHPAQKPLLLMETIVKTYTNEGDLVLDLTMGSGTTGIACLNTQRKFIGIEKDPETFLVAKERLLKALKI